MLKGKFDRFGLGYKPDMKQKRKDAEKRQDRRMARLSEEEVKWKPLTFPHIYRSFVSGGFIYPEQGEVKYSEWVANIVPVPKKDGKKHNPGEWDEECQKAFDKIKQYLANAPILSPPSPDRPLILYLTVFDNSMGCVLGQHDETGKKERYMMESTALNGRIARWQILLSEFDIVYVSQKAIKGSAIADFLTSRALEDYEPLNFDFPNEDLMYVANTEENPRIDHIWKLNFDGASNAIGNEIGAVLVFPSRDHYPVASKLDFDCTNNMAEYEACIMGISSTIERKIKVLKVYGDSALVIYQLKGEWETRDPKLISYKELVLELIDEIDDITFCYLPRDEN
ncbi:uncharacterized protein LOC128043061 [Gossypium raimondii]|uniref:uncharacterized protein LOC128043061 n=1 Tax=Gossypium raimondii TaxID=29730 RepID=UPI00227A6A60|nr:uncharacterized protein LOC128043061 [Gossypium raimondii]